MFDIENITIANSVNEAVNALVQDPSALIIAGGSDVLIQIREGKLAGRNLVSIREIPELKGISQEADGSILIRPLSTFAEVTQHPLVQKHIPTLGFATDQAGGPQLRNIGTIGGNICNGVTSADSAPTLLTLNAVLEITGEEGVRHVPQEEFYEGPSRVSLKQGELLTGIRIAPKDYVGYFGHYTKYARRNAMDIATLSCAVHLKLSQDKKSICDLRLAFGVASPVPIRCRAIEEKLRGASICPQLLCEVGQGALQQTSPRDSWRASKEFRQQLIYELSARAVREAIIKAGGVAL